MRKRVIVAMSGGVDSSVSAYLLKRRGFEVMGITMCFGFTVDNEGGKRPLCCGLEGIEDAKRVCQKLGIRHYVLDFSRIFEEKIIKDFLEEYLKGRTPNPCIRCNQFIKFGFLLDKIKEFDAHYLATGHYARIVRGRKYLLKKAKDKKRDQSYFLYRLTQEQLKQIIFPLGGYTKEKVRRIAKSIGLPVADKLASQEICFIPDNDYRKFLRQRLAQTNTQINREIKPGNILDKEGNILGEHKGICFYTIGQREGLNIKNKRGPFYVIRIDAENNEIIVGKREDTKFSGLIAKEVNFITGEFPQKPIFLKARIRYGHKESDAEVIPLEDKKVKVIFKEPQFAVSPGQSVVFYKKDIVLGGGIIEESLN